MKLHPRPRIAVAVLALAAGCLFGGTASAAAIHGALFTSDVDGNVNVNIYDAKEDVYLNGGPTNDNCAAAGVDDGVYVYKVTNPSGSTLLSTDTIDHRQFTVSGGVITAVNDHPTDPGDCSSLQLQLAPFDDTPNNGGEYKAWLTPVGSFACSLDQVTCGNANHGFINSESKTDNFKVRGVEDEIDARFYDTFGNVLDQRKITWHDTLGASNTKWSYYDPARWILHEAHVEAPEIGTHYIKIENQPGCTVGKVFVDNVKTKKEGPQTVPVRITKTMKMKGTFTVFVDVMCINTN